MIVRTSILTTLFLSMSLLASTDAESDQLGQIKNKINTILDKSGIHFSGTFRSQYLQSMLDKASGDSAIDWEKQLTETNEYTSVDFDINARPNEALGARCMFRMHQNWQNFFSDVANPIFLRWVSIDGNIKDMVRFNVGDYRERYSPLTLWSPDIEIDYEPEIFALKRQEAMNELFLGNNDRILQGVNFNFDAEVVPIFNEFHLNAQIARLRSQGAIIKSGAAVSNVFDDRDADIMDRYFAGANIDLLALRGLGAGFTFIDIFDLTSTYDFQEEQPETFARQNMILGFRLNPTTRIFLDSDKFEIGLKFEGANSTDRDSAWYDTTGTDSTFKTKNISAMAMDAGLTGKIKLGSSGSICLNVGFMNNEKDYRNEMAQSPTFLGQRIMNIENDFIHDARLYTTFDALYDYVFKYTPSQVNKSDNKWTPEPRRKTAYLNAVLGPDEMELIDGISARFDPALQTVLPYGAATPNRSGLIGDLSVKLFNNGVDAGVNFAMLNEITPELVGGVKTAFMKFGGGLAVDVATWAKVLNCMKFSFGYALESAEDKADAAGTSNNYTSGFLNAGLYYNFWQRFSLLAGFQQIVGTEKDVPGVAAILPSTTTLTQTHWALGLEYKVSEGQRFVARVGQIGADLNNSVLSDVANDLMDFKAMQVEAFLLVNF